jgi:hypothetical protein
MSRIVNKSENWEKAYEAFQQVNFAAWDFNTVKESLLDYLKLYYPEDFNDYIESSEFIALLEVFAYVAELSAYRFDLNAHENFISTAERKESILRLAKLLSYTANRNIPARGLVKLVSVSTTERTFDSDGNDLSNVTIRWNDPNNSNWKEQFIIVMNKVLDQNFGTVAPTDRVQVQDVLFERYTVINNTLSSNTLPYTITVSNQSFPMELVSADLNEYGPLEARPEKDLNLGMLYLNDGLGDSSENTGFFAYTKQGSLQRTVAVFDGVTPNQTLDINIQDTNETDIFINNIDPDTNEIIVQTTDLSTDARQGEWVKVDTVIGQNIVFNNVENRNKYEIETLDNDEFRIIFGDGNFANIPSGSFEIWSRTSANTDLTIPTTAMQNVANSFTYQDPQNKQQTLNFTFSLLTPIQNAAPSEDIEHIRRTAPAVYYTQDRMVNGRDYNEYLLQDNTILKLRAVNRTFAGDSKYIEWHDPRESYENVKIFGDDGVLYFDYKQGVEVVCETITAGVLPAPDGPSHDLLTDALIDNHIQPLLGSAAFFTRFTLDGIIPADIETEFTSAERSILKVAIAQAAESQGTTVYFNFNGTSWVEDLTTTNYWFSVVLLGGSGTWELCYESYRLILNSAETKFWNVNNNDPVITNDTLNTNLDTIVVLRANVGTSGVLTQNYNFDVIGQKVISDGADSGLPSIHELYILPDDEDGDGSPDNIDLLYIIGGTDYVYFNREDVDSGWVFQTENSDPLASDLYAQDQIDNPAQADQLWKRLSGVEGVNFAWFHRTPRYHLIDPAATNIIDIYVVTRGYARDVRLWLSGQASKKPTAPSSYQLRSDYQNLLENKMISDTVILHSGNIKPILGPKADSELQATIKVIKSSDRSLSNNQIKSSIVDAVTAFFDITRWEFGETFYFSELSAYIHSQLPVAIDSVVLVPVLNTNTFGDLYQVFAREDEIIQVDISVEQIEIIDSLDSKTLRQ